MSYRKSEQPDGVSRVPDDNELFNDEENVTAACATGSPNGEESECLQDEDDCEPYYALMRKAEEQNQTSADIDAVPSESNIGPTNSDYGTCPEGEDDCRPYFALEKRRLNSTNQQASSPARDEHTMYPSSPARDEHAMYPSTSDVADLLVIHCGDEESGVVKSRVYDKESKESSTDITDRSEKERQSPNMSQISEESALSDKHSEKGESKEEGFDDCSDFFALKDKLASQTEHLTDNTDVSQKKVPPTPDSQIAELFTLEPNKYQVNMCPAIEVKIDAGDDGSDDIAPYLALQSKRSNIERMNTHENCENVESGVESSTEAKSCSVVNKEETFKVEQISVDTLKYTSTRKSSSDIALPLSSSRDCVQFDAVSNLPSDSRDATFSSLPTTLSIGAQRSRTNITCSQSSYLSEHREELFTVSV